MSPESVCPPLIFIGLILFVGVITERYKYKRKKR